MTGLAASGRLLELLAVVSALVFVCLGDWAVATFFMANATLLVAQDIRRRVTL